MGLLYSTKMGTYLSWKDNELTDSFRWSEEGQGP